jgi:hypothetical protein
MIEITKSNKYFIYDSKESWKFFEVEVTETGLMSLDLDFINDVRKTKEEIIEYLEWVVVELQNNFSGKEEAESMAKKEQKSVKETKKAPKKDKK